MMDLFRFVYLPKGFDPPFFTFKVSRSDTGSQSGVISNSTGPSQTMYQTYAIGTARSNRVESIDLNSVGNYVGRRS